MATQLENDKNYAINTQTFQENLFPHYRKLLKDFRTISKAFVLFHGIFVFLLSFELILLFFLFASFSHGAMLATILGSLFLTSFSYCVLIFYFQAKRPQQLKSLRNNFISASRDTLGIPKGESEHHLSISHALTRLASYLDDFEKQFYKLPEFAKDVKTSMEKCSSFFHFEDVFALKLLLLYAAIDEHLIQIRLTPSDFEVHASLANTYTCLSKTYQEIDKLKTHFLFKLRFKELIRESAQKTREVTERAVEEFKILESYAPNDPWVHLQLAKSYQDLSLTEEEIKEYEIILKLRPLDKDSLFRLGALYFEQGKNAKGLEIYEELKKINFKKAEELISFYGTYRLHEEEITN